MKAFTIALLCALVCIVRSYEIVEDQDGFQFYLVPITRHRRQTTVDVSKNPGAGTRLTLGHSGTLYQNDGHQVTGGGFASKAFHPNSPTTVGGNLNYNHLPSGSSLGVNAARTGRFGTDVGVQGTANIWRNQNTRLDAVGSYDRHFGGIGGTGRPQAYGGINFSHRF